MPHEVAGQGVGAEPDRGAAGAAGVLLLLTDAGTSCCLSALDSAVPPENQPQPVPCEQGATSSSSGTRWLKRATRPPVAMKPARFILARGGDVDGGQETRIH